MNPSPIARLNLKRKSIKERRQTGRDRRILDGTMKYQGQYMHVEVANLSESGAYVIAAAMPELADCVTLSIGLPGIGSSVMVSGRVRRVALSSRALHRPGGFGIQFTRYYTSVGRNTLKDHLAA
ncbi:MAG: PilZ domain-containing protein [Deltaproteobacteria bacterium]|nr:PilZ domain-containing protein [Deltaproteobacteria bacterium]